MKDDIRKYVPDLTTVLKETAPGAIKARREQALGEFSGKPDEPGPYELPEKSAAPKGNEHAAEAVPHAGWRSRRVLLAGVVLALGAPLVVAAVFARREGGKTAEQAAVVAGASSSRAVSSSPSSSPEGGPAPSAVPRASANTAGALPTASANANAKVEPRRLPQPTKKAVTTPDAGSTKDQDPELNE